MGPLVGQDHTSSEDRHRYIPLLEHRHGHHCHCQSCRHSPPRDHRLYLDLFLATHRGLRCCINGFLHRLPLVVRLHRPRGGCQESEAVVFLTSSKAEGCQGRKATKWRPREASKYTGRHHDWNAYIHSWKSRGEHHRLRGWTGAFRRLSAARSGS